MTEKDMPQFAKMYQEFIDMLMTQQNGHETAISAFAKAHNILIGTVCSYDAPKDRKKEAHTIMELLVDTFETTDLYKRAAKKQGDRFLGNPPMN
jgi:hypothetical protein